MPVDQQRVPPAPLLIAARAFIAQARWTFAKSMPEQPHEYTLRAREDEGPLDDFTRLIARYGYRARYGGWTYTYFELDGWKYWRIGDVLNREQLAPAGIDPDLLDGAEVMG